VAALEKLIKHCPLVKDGSTAQAFDAKIHLSGCLTLCYLPMPILPASIPVAGAIYNYYYFNLHLVLNCILAPNVWDIVCD